MAATLQGVLEEKRAEAAPNPLYQRSWARAAGLIPPSWRAGEPAPYRISPVETASGEALALGLYLVATAEGIAPEAVTRPQVGALLLKEAGPCPYLRIADTVAEWESRLRAAGHDIDGGPGDDPVAAHWQVLRKDAGAPGQSPDGFADSRWGPGFIEGLHVLLAPAWADEVTF